MLDINRDTDPGEENKDTGEKKAKSALYKWHQGERGEHWTIW